MDHFKNQGQLVNAEELAQMLGITRSAAYTLLNCKSFPTIKIGKRIYAIRDQIQIWIEHEAKEGGYDYER